MRASRWFVLGLAAITLAALGIRVAYTLEVSRDLPFLGDAQTYHVLAEGIAEGRGYVRPGPEGTVVAPGEEIPTAEFPPLFPTVLAVGTVLGAESVTAQKLLTSMLGAVSVLLIGLLGRRVECEPVGLVAAGLAAGYPMLIQVDGSLMGESLYLPLLTAALWATYGAIDRPDRTRFALAGALVGLAALTRTEALLLVPLLLLPEAWRHGGTDRRNRAAAMGVVVLASGLVVTPWVVRNWLTFDTFVPVSNNSGTLLAGANCDRAYQGESTGLWYLTCVVDVDQVGDDEAATMRAYRAAGSEYARDHATDVPRVATIRVLRTFGLWNPSGQINWETFEGRNHTWLTAGHRMYLVLLPLAAGGAVVLIRRRRAVWPLLSTVVLVAVTSAGSYGNQRFRIAAEPALLVLAAVALVAAGGWVAQRSRRRFPEAEGAFTTLP